MARPTKSLFRGIPEKLCGRVVPRDDSERAIDGDHGVPGPAQNIKQISQGALYVGVDRCDTCHSHVELYVERGISVNRNANNSMIGLVLEDRENPACRENVAHLGR